MRYKVGDVVTIKKDLSNTEIYYMEDEGYWDDCTSEMISEGGKQFIVVESSWDGYRLNNNGYNWVDEMFEEEESKL